MDERGVVSNVDTKIGVELVPYRAQDFDAWNSLIERSRNGTFLFNRSYMDYHSDRFQDASFLVFKKMRLDAVIPANRKGDIVYSHQGLTYGGVVSTASVTTVDMLEIFRQWLALLKSDGVQSVLYKPVPWIYHSLPADEELYALFRNSGTLVARQISSAVFQKNRVPFRELRARGAKKARKNDVQVSESSNYEGFWAILEDVLRVMHQTKPVHSVEEMRRLAAQFPGNIKLYVAQLDGQILAGTVVYSTRQVAHAQYIAASAVGKQLGALDLVFDHLLNQVFAETPVFDFGVSTEVGGKVLNEALCFQKEGFGGRGVAYDAWRIEIR